MKSELLKNGYSKFSILHFFFPIYHVHWDFFSTKTEKIPIQES